jgi:hypothetical protein
MSESRPFVVCAVVAVVTFLGLLAAMDAIAPPYDATTAERVTGGLFGHLAHMLSYGASQTSPQGPHGIASYPWQWLVDFKPIVYLNINPAQPAPGLYNIHPAAHFLGIISPSIMLLAVPSLVLAAWRLWGRGEVGTRAYLDAGRRAHLGRVEVGPRTLGLGARVPPHPATADLLAIAWFLGTFIPFVLLSTIWQRTSYLYYMVVVMPAFYIAVPRLAARLPSKVCGLWIVTLVAGAVLLFPFTPLP